jgi:phosphopantetheinyl transferase
MHIRFSQYGKPAHAKEIDSYSNTLLFNVAHSRGIALSAITRKRNSSIGMDIDYLEASVSSRNEALCISNWFVYDLFPEPDYVAALVVEGHPENVTCWQWSE